MRKFINIGFAADTPNGLVVPVVRDAHRKDVYELARHLGVLSEKARAGKLPPADMQGGCFTISSLGGIGGTAFTPIINAPEVAILGVSRSAMRPVFRDGAFVPRLHAAAVAVLRSSRHRRRHGGALHDLPGADARRSPRAARGGAVSRVDLVVPDIGNFSDVEVVDVLVKTGESIEVNSPLITLETDKASMDVPATAAGTLAEVLLKRGDKVSKGSLIARVETRAEQAEPAQAAPPAARPAARAAPAARESPPPAPGAASEGAGDTVRMPQPKASAAERAAADFNASTGLLVLGSGPGGYTAAFRAADLGLKVTLVERWAELGGVCLNVGCIPSKALLHAAKVIEDAAEMSERGIAFGAPKIDRAQLRAWKTSVVRQAHRRPARAGAAAQGRRWCRAPAVSSGPNVLEVMSASGSQRIRFEQCIIAAGSEPVRLPGLPPDPRIMDSTDALELPEFSGGLLVVGGGIIGLEMACVFDALGSRVSVVELTPQLMPGCDPDLVRPLERRIRARYQQILLGTRVAAIEPQAAGLKVSFAGDQAPEPQLFERVLVAVGRVPNGAADRRRARRRRGVRARLHPRRPPDAHQCPAHLCDRRHRLRPAARPQGDA